MNLSNYTIEKLDGKAVAYKLHGKRGGIITLIRNQKTPDLLFPLNGNGRVLSGWLTDRNGTLESVEVL